MVWESNYHTAGMLNDVPLGDLDAAFGNCLAFAKLCASVELWNLFEGNHLELKNDTTIVDFDLFLLLVKKKYHPLKYSSSRMLIVVLLLF